MAEIDKGLPNTRTEIDVPAAEVDLKEEVIEQQPVEVTPEEDGGATINFEPGAINIPGTESHFDNLADILPEDVLDPIGGENCISFQAAATYSGLFLPDLSYISNKKFLTTDTAAPPIPKPLN